MTDQIAPSLATELEQIERFTCGSKSSDSFHDFSIPYMWLDKDGAWVSYEDVLPLLTRAAALARAAETLTTLLSDIAYSGPTSTVEAAVVAEFNLRALVSSEGKGE